MNAFALAFLGGIVGAVLMDITETSPPGWASDERRQRRPGRPLVTGPDCTGNWTHADIQPPARPGEVRTWAGRFTSSSAVAGSRLLYPAFVHAAGFSLPTDRLLGWSDLRCGHFAAALVAAAAGLRLGLVRAPGPAGANALLASPVSHIPYGLGVGVVMALGAFRSPSAVERSRGTVRSTESTVHGQAHPFAPSAAWRATTLALESELAPFHSRSTAAHHVFVIHPHRSPSWPDTLKGALPVIVAAAAFWALASTLLYFLSPGSRPIRGCWCSTNASG